MKELALIVMSVIVGYSISDILLDLKTPDQPVPVVSVYLDPDTGCEYLLTREGHITPRTASDSYHGQSGCRGRFMGME